jgi:hypothetical protein
MDRKKDKLSSKDGKERFRLSRNGERWTVIQGGKKRQSITLQGRKEDRNRLCCNTIFNEGYKKGGAGCYKWTEIREGNLIFED